MRRFTLRNHILGLMKNSYQIAYGFGSQGGTESFPHPRRGRGVRDLCVRRGHVPRRCQLAGQNLILFIFLVQYWRPTMALHFTPWVSALLLTHTSL